MEVLDQVGLRSGQLFQRQLALLPQNHLQYAHLPLFAEVPEASAEYLLVELTLGSSRPMQDLQQVFCPRHFVDCQALIVLVAVSVCLNLWLHDALPRFA